jgi:hypothetical protein
MIAEERSLTEDEWLRKEDISREFSFWLMWRKVIGWKENLRSEMLEVVRNWR